MGKIGSSFDSFLEEQGLADEAYAEAEKRVIAWQLAEAMKAAKVSKTELAKRMNTSRAVVDRMLDPQNSSLTLLTMSKAARALHRRVVISFEEPRTIRKRTVRKKKAAK